VNGLRCPTGIAHGSAGCLTVLVLSAAMYCGLPAGVVSAQTASPIPACIDPAAGGESLVAFCRGHANYLLGHQEEAIADLSRAIELDPSLADAYRWRAYAEYRSQRYLTAVRDCGEYARLRPDESEGYYCRGIMLSRAGDHDAAIADYERAIERAQTAEDAGNAWYGVGVCHERAGRTVEAVAAFRRTLEVYPEQAQAQSALARLTRTK
jgi:tetratricopeptide (TPR) repeat protein